MSIHRDQWESRAQEEISALEDKKVRYGWTAKEADRYHFLKKELEY